MKWHELFSKRELRYIKDAEEGSGWLPKRIVAKLRMIVDDCESVTSGDLELSDFMQELVDEWRDKG